MAESSLTMEKVETVRQAAQTLVPGVTMATSFQPGEEPGGNCSILIDLAEDRRGLILVDVGGKGPVADALIATIRTIVPNDLPSWALPARLMSNLNERLCDLPSLTDHGGLIAAFCGLLDTRSRTLTYASAGHKPPRLVRNHQVIGLEDDRAWPLGVVLNPGYEEKSISLLPDDLLLFYTNGMVDPQAPDRKPFDMECLDSLLLRVMSSNDHCDLPKAVSAVAKALWGLSPSDDQTLIGVSISQ